MSFPVLVALLLAALLCCLSRWYASLHRPIAVDPPVTETAALPVLWHELPAPSLPEGIPAGRCERVLLVRGVSAAVSLLNHLDRSRITQREFHAIGPSSFAVGWGGGY
jgi:hypothetical protein